MADDEVSCSVLYCWSVAVERWVPLIRSPDMEKVEQVRGTLQYIGLVFFQVVQGVDDDVEVVEQLAAAMPKPPLDIVAGVLMQATEIAADAAGLLVEADDDDDDEGGGGGEAVDPLVN